MSVTEKTKCEIVDGAIEILSKRGAWTQGVNARNKHGDEAVPFDDDVVKVCALGALHRAAGPSSSHLVRALAEDIAIHDVRGNGKQLNSLWRWNDTPGRRKDQVIAAFKRYKARVCA